jgi:ceramide glucosyltransferase
VIWAVLSICAVAGVYQAIALAAALSRLSAGRKPARPSFHPPVSILKPVRGAEPSFYDAVRSNAAQDYPDFEMLFGSLDAGDPAAAVVRRLAREFPARGIHWIEAATAAPNAKVGVLADLAKRAHAPVLVVSDSDILVPPDYLRRVIAPLADPSIGLVTCAYRARAQGSAARFEALGVATDFGPSTMVAPFVGVDEFGLGSTLAFRASDLERAGGFAAIADYLADDYRLGRAIHALGLRAVLSEVIVETHLDARSLGDVWRHQLRWARTIRVSRPGGYIGIPITQASLWAVLAFATGHWVAGAVLLALRLAMAATAGYGVLRSTDALKLLWLVPLRDLFAAAVWCAGLFGNKVVWGDRELTLDRKGRIVDSTCH